MNDTIPRLEKKSAQIRKEMFDMCVHAGTGHVTSSLSCMNILVALYYGGILRYRPREPKWPDRDRFILSKGQASPALYTILADLGFFDKKELGRFAQKKGKFGVHLQFDVPGIEITSGSLGLGFGVATGMALGAKMNRELHMVYALLGDGECYEGSVWEAAMFAAHNRLNNLVAIVDRNYMCATDFTENLIGLEPIDEKWRTFGWEVRRLEDGSFEQLLKVLSTPRSRRFSRPTVVIVDSVKGEGIESMSNHPYWHGLAPAGEFARACRKELERSYDHE
jgi:transketolase